MLAGAWDSLKGSVHQESGSLQLPALPSYCNRTLVQEERIQGGKCGTRSATEPPGSL